MKKKTVILFSAAMLCAFCLAGCGIEQTADSTTVEAGQKLNLKAADFFDINEQKADEVKFDTSKVDADTPGEYEATAAYGGKSYMIKVIVADTTAPAVELKQRYAFTNDIAKYDAAEMIDSIYDASDYTVSLIRFEKSSGLSVLDDAALKKLTDSIPIPGDQETLNALGKEEVPSEEGIYRAVLEAKDIYDNTHLEEVYVILDKTGALINDVPDKNVEQEDTAKEPEIHPGDYVITDNVDGTIAAESIRTKLTLKDEENHEYGVMVAYTDRAGNESKAEFVIRVTQAGMNQEEDKKEENSDKEKEENSSPIGSSGGNSNGGTAGNTSNGSISQGSSTEHVGGNSEKTDNSDPEVSVPEKEKPSVELYVVKPMSDGGYYVYVNGGSEDTGYQMLRDHLSSLGCDCSNLGGEWYDSSSNVYLCYVPGYAIYSLEE